MNIKKLFLPLFLIFGSITAFIISIIKPDFSSPKTSLDEESNLSTIKDPSPTISSNPLQLQKLSVLPLHCIGCGKCAIIDSTHFEMNPNTGKAFVISSTNLNSQNLIRAITICPRGAITLE